MTKGKCKMLKSATRMLSVATMLALCLGAADAAPQILASYYRADTPFPEFSHFWGESSKSDWGPEEAQAVRPLGGSVHVFVKNTEASTLEVQDVLLDGVSLKRAVAFSDRRTFKRSKVRAANIYFSDIPEDDLEHLRASGGPIWWRVEPGSIAPGATAEIFVRLRRTPQTKDVSLTLKSTAGSIALAIPVRAEVPRFEGIGFSPNLGIVYAYATPHGANAPVKVSMDGADVTGSSSIGGDAVAGVVPVVIRLNTPLARGSFHTFQAVYDDGSTATAGIRAYADEFRYGMWGGKPGKESEPEIGRQWLQEMALHNVNLQMEMIGSPAVAKLMASNEGRDLMRSLGIKRVVGEHEKDPSPAAYYLADEPDAADSRVEGVPQQSKVGSLAQGLAGWAEELREINVSVPTMVNIDMTFKPDNWYIYGQLADIYAADPYYQTRLAQAYWEKPATLWMYTKATFVLAVGSICQSACAPRPLHLILNCTRRQDEDRIFRFGTPAEKRIEVYYALGAGAKSLSYWWYLPARAKTKGSSGLGAGDAEAKALWTEIGVLGAEVRTAGPLVTRSCPANLPITAPRYLWVRSLLAGLDSAIILCVNDDYANDRLGTTYKPVEDAELTVTLPSWLEPKAVFEINAEGIEDVKHDRSGDKLNLHLGTVDLTRMIVVTSDQSLRERLQQLYADRFAANVAVLAGLADSR